MRTTFASFATLLLLVAACGGKTNGGGGGDGSSGSSGGSSGSSGGSGGSSGGASSSGSGGEGAKCTPLAGCDSNTECPAGDGCNTCSCADGAWSCTTLGCVEEGGIGPGTSLCPAVAPNQGSACGPGTFACNYASNDCSEDCTCENDAWNCGSTCVSPACPPSPPEDPACSSIGLLCSWDLGGCSTEECECDSSGVWSCGGSGCSEDGGLPLDAGFPDEGPPDEGPPDTGTVSACPAEQPAESSACSEEGTVCSYNLCPTNCLCSNDAWVCAKQQGCP